MNVIYQVSAIVGRRVKKGRVEYRVRWKGFPPEEDTWEPSYGLRDSCFTLIRSFNAEHKKRHEQLGNKSTEMGSSRSPSPTQKHSPSVCSSDQLSLASTPSSPLTPAQSLSPPIPPQRPSKSPTKRSPVKSASFPSNSTGPGRKKVLVVFNSTSCESPLPSTDGKKKFPFSTKSISDSAKTALQRDNVKMINIAAQEHRYRNSQTVHQTTNSAKQKKPKKTTQMKVETSTPVSEIACMKQKQKNEPKKQNKLKAKKIDKNIVKKKKKKEEFKSGKKTQEYIKLKCKSLKKVDAKKIGFKRLFEPPHHQRQLELAMKKEKQNLPVVIVYALDRIKKLKRKGDVDNIYEMIRRMEPKLTNEKALVHHTVAAMDSEGLLLRYEGSNGNCSFRVSPKAIDILDIDNSDSYLNISDRKSPSTTPVKQKSIKTTVKEKKKGDDPVRKRKANGDLKEAAGPLLPPPAVKRRKMLEESSEVSASSSSGPPTDASYQAKLNGHHSNASSTSSSQSLVNKACNIIESIQNKSKTNTHMYFVGKHVILLPPSANSNDPSISKEIKNLPHKRLATNGSSSNGSSNGSNAQSDSGQAGSSNLTIERRISLRQTESAYRYKEIMVKRQDNFVEIVLQSTIGIMRNVFTVTTLQELSSALQSAYYDPECRLVVLTGSDLVFSHGIDLSQVASTGRRSHALVETLRSFLTNLVNFPKPVVAVVNGPAIGLGAALLPLCDVVYASDKAVLQLPYCFLGQTPEGGSSFTLPRVVGPALAADMFMSARRLTAKEACERGLVSDVFWPSKLMLHTLTRCRRIAQCSPRSLESTKCIIRSQQRERLMYAIESECSMLAECWETVECKQKIQEFLNSNLDSLL